MLSISHYFPVDGSWGQWTAFSDCSTICGSGSTKRTRQCDSPPPQYNGKECTGPSSQSKECSCTKECPGT